MAEPALPRRVTAGRRTRIAVACLLVGILGGTVGLLLAGQHDARVGPVDVRFSVRLSLSGGTEVRVPPLGSIRFASHRGPLALRATVLELRPEVARSLAQQPGGFATLGDRVGEDLQKALVRLAVQSALAALLTAGVLALLILRSVRRTAVAVGLCVVALGASAASAGLSWRPQSVREPQFTGLIASAPTALGDVDQIAANFSQYRLALGQLVGNVVELYHVTSALPTYAPGTSTIAVLHVSDLHLNPEGIDLISSLVEQFHAQAVLDTGDLTDHGSAAEGVFVSQLDRIRVPYVYVRGNHDSPTTVAQVRRVPGAVVLDGTTATVAGLRVAGIADPHFTPDKTAPEDAVTGSEGQVLASSIEREGLHVDIAMVHEPIAATALRGHVPLVLAGHLHHRENDTQDGTLLLVEGSTGGAGLRGLEGDTPTPLECSVLYLDAVTHQLQAWDEVTVGGLGTDSVTVSRHVVPPADTASAPAPSSPEPATAEP